MIRVGEAPYLECSSAGDKRFSAFYARVGSRSIEEIYQAAKVFEGSKTGLHWRRAKGRKAVNGDAVSLLYRELWRIYLDLNPALWQVLCDATGLSDRFGQPGHNCQAAVLWDLRNEYLDDDL